MSSELFNKFADKFGEDNASAIVAAAESHETGINGERKGSDPFRWALLIAIGYECISKDSYRQYHKITAPFEEIKAWMKEHGDLANHDGDCDYLSALCGDYDEYMPAKADVSA